MIKRIVLSMAIMTTTIGSVFCASITKNNVTISLVDYSKRQMASFFSELPENCAVNMYNLNNFLHLYPVRFIISNNSDTTYKLTPQNIGGSISLDYKKIIRGMPLESKGNGGFIASIIGSVYSGIGLLGAAGHTLIRHVEQNRYRSFCEHFKKSENFRFLLKATAGFGTIFAASTLYAISTTKNINSQRLKWLEKNALPQEGRVIKPGEQAEIIVFLKQETYNRESIMVSLVEPGIGAIEPFIISLTN